MKIRVLIVISVFAGLLFAACNGNDKTCRKERTIVVGVSLYKTTYDENTEMYVISPTTEKLTIQGIDSDSILYDDASLSKFNLPLHTQRDTTSFLLQRDSIGADTLTIFHRNETEFISLECGCFVYHTIENALSSLHQIDSVIIENTSVQNVAENHLRIYYRQR